MAVPLARIGLTFRNEWGSTYTNLPWEDQSKIKLMLQEKIRDVVKSGKKFWSEGQKVQAETATGNTLYTSPGIPDDGKYTETQVQDYLSDPVVKNLKAETSVDFVLGTVAGIRYEFYDNIRRCYHTYYLLKGTEVWSVGTTLSGVKFEAAVLLEFYWDTTLP